MHDQQGLSADGKPRVFVLSCLESSNLIPTSTATLTIEWTLALTKYQKIER